MRLRSFLLLGLPLTLVAAAPFGYSLTSSTPHKAPPKLVDKRKTGERLCASRAVNERLKSRIFDDAAAAGDGPSSNLDLLASFSEVRMDQPLLKSQDEELGVTVCTGRFVLLLPPGSEQKFGGRTLLQADVEYAAQPAADGSGLVYQLRGAESIAYRLAVYNLRPDQALAARAEARPDVPIITEPLPAMALADKNLPIEAVIATAPPAVPPVPIKPATAAEVKAPAAVEPTKPVQIAKVVKEPKPAAVEKKPVKLAKLEKVTPAKAPSKPVKLAKAATKKAEKAAKPDLTEIRTAKVEKEAKLAEDKRIELAAAKKAKEAKEAKERKALLALAEKAEKAEKARKLALAATAKKDAERKLAAAAAAKKDAERKLAKAALEKKARQQLAAAAARKALPPKPKPVAVAKAAPKQSREPGGATNSFLVYEQRKAAAQPAEDAPAPRPTAARDSCDAVGGAEARLVCANPNLKAKQRSVANTYYAALEDADGQTRRMLTGSGSRFAAYLNRCSTASCLAGAYDDRLAEIRDIMNHY